MPSARMMPPMDAEREMPVMVPGKMTMAVSATRVMAVMPAAPHFDDRILEIV